MLIHFDKKEALAAQQFHRTLVDKGLLPSCINCDQWRGDTAEKCGKYNARPPATVIAVGCPEWEDIIPF